MRTIISLAAAAVAANLWLTSSAQAAFLSGDIIQLGNRPGGPGGLFHVTEPGDPATSFLTICAHVGEDLDFNTNYMAVVSDRTDPDDLPVDPLAAWLFTQFLDQSPLLTHFDYGLIGPGSNFDEVANNQARALQLGIWIGMGFTEQKIRFDTGWSSTYIEELKEDYLEYWLDNYAASGWEEAGHTGQIKVLNLYAQDQFGNYTINVQDQLYRVPEPSPLMLLALSSVGLALANRIRTRRLRLR